MNLRTNPAFNLILETVDNSQNIAPIIIVSSSFEEAYEIANEIIKDKPLKIKGLINSDPVWFKVEDNETN